MANFRVRVYNKAGAFLDLNDYNEISNTGTYTTEVFGLWDLPTREVVLSQGFEGGPQFLGVNDTARNITMHTVIETGVFSNQPIRNATHNAARDALIKFLADREPLTLEVDYPGSAGGEYWRIPVIVTEMPHPDNKSRGYDCTLTAPNPALVSTVLHQETITLPVAAGGTWTSDAATDRFTSTTAHGLTVGQHIKFSSMTGSYTLPSPAASINGWWFVVASVVSSTVVTLTGVDVTANGGSGTAVTDRKQVTLTTPVGGNIYAPPVLQVTATATKTRGYQYRRKYTITSRSDKTVHKYPVMIPFDFVNTAAAGKINPGTAPGTTIGQDIRVIVNDQFASRWFRRTNNASLGGIFFYMDLAPGEVQDIYVLYGHLGAPDFANFDGSPMFDLENSDNTAWSYKGAFMDRPAVPTNRTAQWNIHNRQAQSSSPMQPFTVRMASPWLTINDTPQHPVNAAGAYAFGGAVLNGYCGMALHHPLGIGTVTMDGKAHADPAQVKLIVRERTWEGVITDGDQLVFTYGGTYINPAAWGPYSKTWSGEGLEAIIICFRSTTQHIAADNYTGGTDNIAINPPINTWPSVVQGSEEAVYMLDATIENTDLGEIIYLEGMLPATGGSPPYEVAQVDVANQLVVEGVSPFAYAWSINLPIRSVWLRLMPGTNNILFIDEDTDGSKLDIFWSDRRL